MSGGGVEMELRRVWISRGGKDKARTRLIERSRKGGGGEEEGEGTLLPLPSHQTKPKPVPA